MDNRLFKKLPRSRKGKLEFRHWKDYEKQIVFFGGARGAGKNVFGIDVNASEEELAKKLYADWTRQEKILKQRIPEFNLTEAFDDDVFYDAVVNGLSIEAAYELSCAKAEKGNDNENSKA